MSEQCPTCGAPRPRDADRCPYCQTVHAPMSLPGVGAVIASTDFARGSYGRFKVPDYKQPERPEMVLERGSFFVRYRQYAQTWALLDLFETHDDCDIGLRIKFEAPPVTDKPGCIILGCRETPPNGYRLFLYSTGSVALRNKVGTDFKTLGETYRHAAFRPGEMNEFRFVASRDRLRAMLNGAIVVSIRDTTYSAGKMTVLGSGAGAPAWMTLGDVVVRDPGG